eukprot:gb/GFBE01036918.1/.p1 GENE.gb/GFBE01036918.1/~~gb/GFBE01036918.1/.p1  ORF type:complete len:483 (+),score=77.34 gb/GFBE01036918.1/:1-1449(+)
MFSPRVRISGRGCALMSGACCAGILWAACSVWGVPLDEPHQASSVHDASWRKASHRRLEGEADEGSRNVSAVVQALEMDIASLKKQNAEQDALIADLEAEEKDHSRNATRAAGTHHRRDIPWTWQAWLVAGVFVIFGPGCQVLLLGLCACGKFAMKGTETDLVDDLEEVPLFWGAEQQATDTNVPKLLYRELRLMMLLPLLPLLAQASTTCEKGMPNWVYLIYLPILLRSKWLEWRILKSLDVIPSSTWTILYHTGLGALEHMDFFTDGAFPLQAYMCDDVATEPFAASLQQSWAWPAAPLVLAIRFWGVTLSTLAGAVLSQQVLVSLFSGGGFEGPALAADMLGYALLANHYDDKVPDRHKGSRDAMTSLTKLLLENCVQLWVQATFFGATFDTIGGKARLQLQGSIGIGLAVCTAKAVRGMYTSLRKLCTTSHDREVQTCGLICQIMALLCVGWTGAKLYYAFNCPSHLFNISSGCVVLE